MPLALGSLSLSITHNQEYRRKCARLWPMNAHLHHVSTCTATSKPRVPRRKGSVCSLLPHPWDRCVACSLTRVIGVHYCALHLAVFFNTSARSHATAASWCVARSFIRNNSKWCTLRVSWARCCGLYSEQGKDLKDHGKRCRNRPQLRLPRHCPNQIYTHKKNVAANGEPTGMRRTAKEVLGRCSCAARTPWLWLREGETGSSIAEGGTGNCHCREKRHCPLTQRMTRCACMCACGGGAACGMSSMQRA